MSRWMMPFWWACWIAWHTGTKSSRRSRGVILRRSQNSVIGVPFTSSMTRKGRPVLVAPTSNTRAMFGWSIIESACRSASNRAITDFESIPALMSLMATSRLTGSICWAIQTAPMPPSPIDSRSLYLPAMMVPASTASAEENSAGVIVPSCRPVRSGSSGSVGVRTEVGGKSGMAPMVTRWRLKARSNAFKLSSVAVLSRK